MTHLHFERGIKYQANVQIALHVQKTLFEHRQNGTTRLKMRNFADIGFLSDKKAIC